MRYFILAMFFTPAAWAQLDPAVVESQKTQIEQLNAQREKTTADRPKRKELEEQIRAKNKERR